MSSEALPPSSPPPPPPRDASGFPPPPPPPIPAPGTTPSSATPPPPPPTAPAVPPASPPSPPADPALPFTQIDRYKIEAFLGAGAMGQVYRATHSVTKRACALKILPDALAQQPSFVTRFTAEAEVLARLNHPHIVQIYSGGEADGKLFLEMELIAGGDLQKRLDKHAAALPANAPHRGLPEAEVSRYLDGVLAALDYAHRARVVHRDLKPANILLHADGAVKVSDFGLAAAAGVDFQKSVVADNLSLSKISSMETMVAAPSGGSGSFAGTILYMSPEALRGESPDPRDDLFSVGVIAYCLLTGKTPAVNYKPVSKLRPEVNKGWDAFIVRCLEEERAARFQTAAEARAALPKRSSNGLKIALIVGGIAVVLAAGAVGSGVWLVRQLIKSRSATASVATAPATNESETPAAATTPTTNTSTAAPEPVAPAPVQLEPPPAIVTPAKTQRAQAITFAQPADLAYDGSTLRLEATASSGLPVAFTIESGPATLADNEVYPTGPGTVTVRCSQPGDDTFLAAESVRRTFRVTRSAPVAPTPTATTPAVPSASTVTAEPPPPAAATSTPSASTASSSTATPPPATAPVVVVPTVVPPAPRERVPLPAPGSSTVTPIDPLAWSAVEKAKFGSSAGAVPIPAGVSAEGVRAALQAALTGRGWMITEKGVFKVGGYYRQKSTQANVTFLFNRENVELYCLGYDLDSDSGERRRVEPPSAWLSNLRKEVAARLNDAARR